MELEASIEESAESDEGEEPEEPGVFE